MNNITQKQINEQKRLDIQKVKDIPTLNSDYQVDLMIKKQLENNFRYSDIYQDTKIKSKSVASLNSKILTKPNNYLDKVQQRFERKNTQILSAISQMQKQCEPFGGVKHIQKEMIKHKISKKQQFDYYNQRVKEINKNFSLPKLLALNIENNKKSSNSLVRSISQKNAGKNYNKWYINPAQRFKSPQIEARAQNVTKYVENIMKKHNKNVSFKYKYAATLISQTGQRLGRKPMVSIYAQIKQ